MKMTAVRTFYHLALAALGVSLAMLSGCSGDAPPGAVGLLEWDRVELVAETNEPILEIMADEGELLQADATILRQDPRRVQAQLDEAGAVLVQAQAKLAELKRGPREERIDEARARLQGLLSEEENAMKELMRAQSLLAEKLISPEVVDAARTRQEKAAAEKNASRATLEELLHGATAEELQQAEAAVAQAKARVRVLQVTLDNLVLRAPRSGLLDSLSYEEGERPPAGAIVAVMLINSAPYARVYVPEPLRAQVSQGSQATIHIDGLDTPFHGRVRMISSEASFTPYYSLTERDRSRLSYLAEVELIDSGARQLPSGMPVRVEFQAPE